MPLFPPIEPFDRGHLPVADGNTICWEASGNPRGKPVIYLHGGPGSGIRTGHRRWFDPHRFLIVALDQRGCGRSRPLVTDSHANLDTNTTAALLDDIEALRAHLQIQRWLVVGVSWGSTLALAYAQAHPERVSEIILWAVTTTSVAEVAWITEGMRRFFPREWQAFEMASGRTSTQRVIDAYDHLIRHPDASVREQAARAWCAWEDTHVSLDPNHVSNPRFEDPLFRQVFATLVIHYWKHAGFVPDGALLADMPRIAHLPGVLIHGRLDVSGPLDTAWRLHRAWPASELIVVEREGHGGPVMIDNLTRAIARFGPP